MKWFGRKAGGQPRPFLLRMWQGSVAVGEWPRSYEAQVREAYLANPVAQRAVRLMAESVAWRRSIRLCERFTGQRSEEHTSELQSLMRISYAVFCLKKKRTS